MASFIPIIIPNNTINLFCRPNHMHLHTLFGVDTTHIFFFLIILNPRTTFILKLFYLQLMDFAI